ncbi:hypothetical protein Mapa_002547 [Marchantia paleacea]|nr:hypothetical protein Mapa_002547 [Marchantia paleacea]
MGNTNHPMYLNLHLLKTIPSLPLQAYELVSLRGRTACPAFSMITILRAKMVILCSGALAFDRFFLLPNGLPAPSSPGSGSLKFSS